MNNSYTIIELLQILRGRMIEGVEQITIVKKENGRYGFKIPNSGRKTQLDINIIKEGK